MTFEAYSQYLLYDYVSPRTGMPLGDGPRADYPSRLRSLEQLLGMQIETARPDTLRLLAPALNRQPSLAGVSPKVVANMATALRSYAGFLETRAGIALRSAAAGAPAEISPATLALAALRSVKAEQLRDRRTSMDDSAEPEGAISDRGAHSVHSALREKIVEHVFIGELLRCLWRRKVYEVEVLRSEVDSAGYDLVIGCQKTVRHIQLKTILAGGKAAEVNVGLRLMEVSSGCVVWIVVTPDLGIESYLWFGGLPGEPLPDVRDGKVAKHTKGNAVGEKTERANHRSVPRSRFTEVKSTRDLIELLFALN